MKLSPACPQEDTWCTCGRLRLRRRNRFARDIGPLFDTVACYGGDGTLNETISGLMQLAHKPLLGYLPAGSHQ